MPNVALVLVAAAVLEAREKPSTYNSRRPGRQGPDDRRPGRIVQLRLPVKVVVFNNGALGFIELEQKSTGFLTFGTTSTIRTSRRWPKPSACAGSGSKIRPR
jgi:hypothetical protein